jgi:menaquinone-9 beta-reductase
MKVYDVIIVGAGPAGLFCAENLKGSGLSVLLLEKNLVFGDKVCAGGITQKDINLLGIPEKLFEHKISDTRLQSAWNHSATNAAKPFVYTVNRRELAEWQRGKIDSSYIEILTGAKVTKIGKESITVNETNNYGYRYLVGADGYASLVRRFLELPIRERLIGIQYQIPLNGNKPRFEIHLHSGYFHSWYGWVFPHRETLAVGCVADPRFVSSRRLKKNFHHWLKKMKLDISGATYESQPIGCDYRGWQFGNIFLAGEAAGFASWLTGEGIYQCLVSGKAVAEKILDKDHQSKELNEVLKYNEIQKKITRILIYAGPLRFLLHEILILMMKSSFIKRKINGSLTE